MTRNATPEKRQPTLEPLDEEVDHAAARPAGRLIVEYGDHECPYSRLAPACSSRAATVSGWTARWWRVPRSPRSPTCAANDDGRLEAALLPPQADALLNRAAAPRHWLGAPPSPPGRTPHPHHATLHHSRPHGIGPEYARN